MLFLLLPILTLLGSVLAQDVGARSTFIYNSTGAGTKGNYFLFTINIVKSTGDIYFHFDAPASGSWVGVGFGDKMQGTLMILAYPSQNTTGITISPRVGNYKSEPTYDSSIKVEKVWDSALRTPNTIDNNINQMYIDGVCRGCANRTGSILDLSNQRAPFIFATGPGTDMNTDDLAAPLKRHNFYGSFNLNLTAATSLNSGSVPPPVNGSYNYNGLGTTSTNKDTNAGPAIHAALMCIAWILIFPFGSLLLRFFNKVILHAVMQVIGLVFVFAAFCCGCYISMQYNRSKTFRSAHQVIGLILMFGLLVQLALGIVGHRIFKKTGSPAKFAKIHAILGSIMIVIAIINGGMGWGFGGKWFRCAADVADLSGNPWMNTIYAITVAAIGVLFLAARLTAHCCIRRRQKNKAESMPEYVGQDGYQYPQFTSAPKQPYANAMPMQTFQSTDSVPQYSYQQPHPRPMV
ncbi:hypothetical protein AMS68_004412 [Peltaster fructicola]|uniref:DOMON domain-containing protein n=1 Tax=Peltaster fructicola TaxID=286661 RepID=A0A6H0XW60_9PEZI|nr:hypothetical protein AMS68_004412 [Peltaster fructicola]